MIFLIPAAFLQRKLVVEESHFTTSAGTDVDNHAGDLHRMWLLPADLTDVTLKERIVPRHWHLLTIP